MTGSEHGRAGDDRDDGDDGDNRDDRFGNDRDDADFGDESQDRYLVVNSADLSADSLRGLVEEFVSRDGTDYGHLEKTLNEKVDAVIRQLEADEVRIVFDREEERANLVSAREL